MDEQFQFGCYLHHFNYDENKTHITLVTAICLLDEHQQKSIFFFSKNCLFLKKKVPKFPYFLQNEFFFHAFSFQTKLYLLLQKMCYWNSFRKRCYHIRAYSLDHMWSRLTGIFTSMKTINIEYKETTYLVSTISGGAIVVVCARRYLKWSSCPS